MIFGIDFEFKGSKVKTTRRESVWVLVYAYGVTALVDIH